MLLVAEYDIGWFLFLTTIYDQLKPVVNKMQLDIFHI